MSAPRGGAETVDMIEIRFHGRGGQGAVVASRVLAEAAFLEGRHVQSFPAFGLERRGAPVMAFTRIQDSPIYNHSQIYAPDLVVVLDASLMDIVDVTAGLKKDGLVLVNSATGPADIPGLVSLAAAAVNAGEIATANGLGSRTHPIVNTSILGALARASGYVKLESVVGAIEKIISIRPGANVKACREAYEAVRMKEASLNTM